MTRFLDVVTASCLFLCGLSVIGISVSLWLGPLRSLADPVLSTAIIAAGAVIAVSALAVLVVRRIAGFVGAVTLLILACYYAWNDFVFADLLLPALFAVVAVSVYWRFVHR